MFMGCEPTKILVAIIARNIYNIHKPMVLRFY
jgi:hypothetical protein